MYESYAHLILLSRIQISKTAKITAKINLPLYIHG